MSPSFFKKLGPINLNTIKSVINCTTINLHEDECFSDFVSIDNLSENSLSFLYDSEYSKIVELLIIVTAILSWLSLINYTYARD